MTLAKTAVFLTVAVTALPAIAADPVPAPVAPLTSQDSIYDWTGFYIGIGGGTGYLLDEVTVPAIGSTTINGIGGTGFFGKLTVGYDHLFHNGFVAGAYVSGRYGDVETTWTIGGLPLLAGSVTADYGVDVIGRLGYAFTPSTMAYVLGGYSWQHFELSSPIAALSTTWSDSGFVVGLGLESAFADNWSWASEYRYSQYSGTAIAALGGTTVNPVTHTFHSSLNYRFGGGPSGVQRNAFGYNWSGFKIGGAVSAGVTLNELATSGGGTSLDGLATEGFLGEINIGYDWAFGERWLAGVVLAGEYIGGSSSLTAFGVASVTADAGDFGFDALLRAGYRLNDRTLGYVIGGYTWQELFASASLGPFTISTDVGVNAFTIGTGTELALSERTSAYIEYRYTMYEDVNLGSLLTIEPTSHTVRLGAKFKLFE